MKRLLDVVLSIFGLILTGPLMLVAALLIRASMGRPVLFRQLRPGRYGKPFLLYKFKTMRNPAGTVLPDAARLTRLGSALRKYSIDELPQLWNVLRGEMSLVGPRPLLMEYLPLYSPRQARRHDVPPGITGWAQVNGRNALSWEEKLELDVWYVERGSLKLDLYILWKTLVKVRRAEGISQPGHTTMEKFTGTRP